MRYLTALGRLQTIKNDFLNFQDGKWWPTFFWSKFAQISDIPNILHVSRRLESLVNRFKSLSELAA